MFHVYRTQFKRHSEKGVRESIQELRLKGELLVTRLVKEPDCASDFTWIEWAALFEVVFSRDPDRSDFRRLPDISIVVALNTFREYAMTADIGRSGYFLNLWREAIVSLWTYETGDIAEAAETCLPVIQARLQQEKDKKTLLRPGERGKSNRELLLPASASTQENRAELLRASSDVQAPESQCEERR